MYTKMQNRAKTVDCELCGKELHRYKLKQHINIVHIGKKNYKCTLCPRSFGMRGDLNSHKKSVHEGERKYKCSECEKSFSRGGVLKLHIKAIHRVEREHKCELCEHAQ